MEFLSQNFLDTTTQISVGSGTLTSGYIMTRDKTLQYVSDGFNNDALTATITISFDTTQTVDRIAMLETNAKKVNIYYNGLTANAFALTGPTTTSQWTGNTMSDMYLQVGAPVFVTSVTFDIYSTQVANSEKAVSYILLSQNEYTFPRLPAAGDYQPTIKPKELKHELSTGGVRTHVVDQKWNIKLKFKYYPDADVANLRAIYDEHLPKIFVPWGTATAWDGVLFESNWTGNFDFYSFSDNATASGKSGSIQLEET